MTRRYGHPIQVEADNGHPLSFIWRGTRYQVYTILDTWHLRDRWWAGDGASGSSDRTYYRLDCSRDVQCEVYFDAVTSIWILDRVYD